MYPSQAHRRAAVLLMAVVALLIGVLSVPSQPRAQADPATTPPTVDTRPQALVVNDLPHPVDVDLTSAPRLGWQVTGRDQAAYQVQVGVVGSDVALWDTGRVDSVDQVLTYAGPALSATAAYWWQVRVTDDRGAVSGWSEQGGFGTAPGSSFPGASPIWAPAPTAWTDYTLETTLTVTAASAGITFRQTGTTGYMWQFRSAQAGTNVNTLVPHTRVNGTFTALAPVALPAFATGTEHAVRITVAGSTITTWWDGVQVDQRTLTTSGAGSVGVRTGRTEAFTLDDLSVTAADGSTLLRSDFTSNPLTCGVLAQGRLSVGNALDCLARGESAEWSFLRGEVDLDRDDVTWAHVYATGSSPEPARQYVYKLWLDGEFVGLGPTRSIGGEVRYDGYDVTELVQQADGELALGALTYTTQDQRFLASLVVGYADGSTQTFGTGAGWTALRGSSVFPAGGRIDPSRYFVAPTEDVVAAAYPVGFDTPGFDDSAWYPATVKPAFTRLTPTPTAKVEQQLREPASVQYVDGTYRIDYGRTWIGGLSLDLSGTAGQVVDIRYGEVRNSDGSARWQLATGNQYRDRWSLRDGEQHLETWGMRVFRYVDVAGLPAGLTAADFPALALVYPFDTDAAVFDSSNDGLDQVWELSRNSIEALNMNMYADSWTRERDNYEADAYLQQLADLYLSSDPTLGDYSMDYFTEGRRTWPTEWPLYVILGYKASWQQTGDTTALAADYADLQRRLPARWIDPATGLVVKSTGTNCSSATDCDIVDWPGSQRDGYVFSSTNTVLNALSYRSYADMAEIATALGRTADAASYRATADRLRAAINQYLWDPAKGAYRDGRSGAAATHYAVHATAFATAFGIPATPEQDAQAAAYLTERGMACSVYCSGFLLQSLYDGDRGDSALGLLTSTGRNSWLNMIAQGAGATMEAWDLRDKSNTTYSHPWAAAPAYTIPRGLFGIEPTTPGYRTFDVRPQADGLEWAHITVPTVLGQVGAAFETTDGRTDVGVHVPSGSTATVSVPAGAATQAYLDGVPVTSTAAEGYLLVEVGGGCHVLSTAAGVVGSDRLTAVCPAGYAAPDDTAPVTTASFDDRGGFAQRPVAVTLAATDAGNGVAETRYTVDGGAEQVYTDPFEVAGAGVHQVRFWSIDRDGNVEAARTATVTLAGPDGATAAPGQGFLSSDNGQDTGLQDGDYRITVNKWWGPAASSFELYENGVLLQRVAVEGRSLMGQSAVVPVTGRVDGTYVYTGVLVNSMGERATSSVTVTVRDASPGRPVLSSDNWDGDGSYRVTANLWWGTNATSWRLLEDGMEVRTGQLTAATPRAQSVRIDLSGRPVGSHAYVVEFTNPLGTTASAPHTVQVRR